MINSELHIFVNLSSVLPALNPASIQRPVKTWENPASLHPRMTRKSGGLGNFSQGRLGNFIKLRLGINMPHISKKLLKFNPLVSQQRINLNQYKSQILFIGLLLGTFLYPQDLWAHTGELLKDEIDKVEKLFTGGYMRLGLLGVCGFAAIYGIVKQNGWIFASGILGCVFAYFMKDWILKTFTMVI